MLVDVWCDLLLHARSPVVSYLIRSLQNLCLQGGQESHEYLILTIYVVYVCSRIDKSVFMVFIKYRDVAGIDYPQPDSHSILAINYINYSGRTITREKENQTGISLGEVGFGDGIRLKKTSSSHSARYFLFLDRAVRSSRGKRIEWHLADLHGKTHLSTTNLL
jgi:hypothetical protein